MTPAFAKVHNLRNLDGKPRRMSEFSSTLESSNLIHDLLWSFGMTYVL